MALPPGKLALTTEEIKVVEQWEEIIDEALPALPATNERRVESFLLRQNSKLGRDLTLRIHAEIVRRYKAAGWIGCRIEDGAVVLTERSDAK